MRAFETKLAAMMKVDALRDELPIAPKEWDSVDVLELIAAIDEVYGVTVPIKKLNESRTVGELRALIAEGAASR